MITSFKVASGVQLSFYICVKYICNIWQSDQFTKDSLYNRSFITLEMVGSVERIALWDTVFNTPCSYTPY